MNTKQIECPNCGDLIDVDNLLAVKLEADIRKSVSDEYKVKLNNLSQKEKDIKKKEESIDKEIQNRFKPEPLEQPEHTGRTR